MLVPANISEMRAWCLAAREAGGDVVVVLVCVGVCGRHCFVFFLSLFCALQMAELWRGGGEGKRAGLGKVTSSIVLGRW